MNFLTSEVVDQKKEVMDTADDARDCIAAIAKLCERFLRRRRTSRKYDVQDDAQPQAALQPQASPQAPPKAPTVSLYEQYEKLNGMPREVQKPRALPLPQNMPMAQSMAPSTPSRKRVTLERPRYEYASSDDYDEYSHSSEEEEAYKRPRQLKRKRH